MFHLFVSFGMTRYLVRIEWVLKCLIFFKWPSCDNCPRLRNLFPPGFTSVSVTLAWAKTRQGGRKIMLPPHRPFSNVLEKWMWGCLRCLLGSGNRQCCTSELYFLRLPTLNTKQISLLLSFPLLCWHQQSVELVTLVSLLEHVQHFCTGMCSWYSLWHYLPALRAGIALGPWKSDQSVSSLLPVTNTIPYSVMNVDSVTILPW